MLPKMAQEAALAKLRNDKTERVRDVKRYECPKKQKSNHIKNDH